jgi:hypothetical protein
MSYHGTLPDSPAKVDPLLVADDEGVHHLRQPVHARVQDRARTTFPGKMVPGPGQLDDRAPLRRVIGPA